MKTVVTEYCGVLGEEILTSSEPDLRAETSTNTGRSCGKTQGALALRVVVYLSNGTCTRNDLVSTDCLVSVCISA
jgi:hypothetical protein